jgi:AraC-like DNA-binding protein
MIQNLLLGRPLDRLSAFFDAFPLEVKLPARRGEPAREASMLYLLQDEAGQLAELVLVVRGGAAPARAAIAVEVAFGGSENPLLNTLPDALSSVIDDDQPALRHIARAFLDELRGGRCGHQQALHRLGEVIVLMMLRSAIEGGSTRPCLLAGLAHPVLHSVLVALHESPAHAWTVEELADRAGLSRSHFMALFPKVVGTTAMAYLTRWRVQLGRRELRRGNAKVKAVARRVGFSSAEAFSRAYQREFGRSPVDELRL